MKKSLACIVFGVLIAISLPVEARHCHSHYYLTHKDYYQEEILFTDCDKHHALKETTVYFYSNGSRNTYVTCTIYNKDGSILESGCSNVKHIIYKNRHYFTFYKNKRYQILSEDGKFRSVKNYKAMKNIGTNKLLVKLDKKYGVIDLKENVIIPIKYKKFEQLNQNLFLTKLNGFWGIINSSNKICIRNEYDKIKPIQNSYLLKKYDKYGLADKDGNIILSNDYDSIKSLDEYLVAKKDGRYILLDSDGKILTNESYRKIKMERNALKLQLEDKSWKTINQTESVL